MKTSKGFTISISIVLLIYFIFGFLYMTIDNQNPQFTKIYNLPNFIPISSKICMLKGKEYIQHFYSKNWLCVDSIATIIKTYPQGTEFKE